MKQIPLVLLLSLSFPHAAPSQQAPRKPLIQKAEVKLTPAWSGPEMFRTWCASCHGVTARGDGPAAPALKSPVPDLTTVSARNGGKFPEVHLLNVIKGNPDMSAHGSRDMPVWGTIFHNMSNGEGEEALRLRNLVRYIESLQR